MKNKNVILIVIKFMINIKKFYQKDIKVKIKIKFFKKLKILKILLPKLDQIEIIFIIGFLVRELCQIIYI